MKQGDLSQWNNIEACKNLLFFAQLVNELLFDYSIPSNRISTLNSHFLCLDAINVINGIEKSGVNEGSLKPIILQVLSSILWTAYGLAYFIYASLTKTVLDA